MDIAGSLAAQRIRLDCKFQKWVNFEQKLEARLDSPCESFERVAIENAQMLPSKHLL